MTISTTPQLDSIATAFKEAASKLADLLRQQAALKSELETAATDADAAGLGDFADVLRNMGATLGALATQTGRPALPPTRRRGRPPKSSEQPSVS